MGRTTPSVRANFKSKGVSDARQPELAKTIFPWRNRQVRPDFLSFDQCDGLCWTEEEGDPFPSSLSRWTNYPLDLDNDGTHFVFAFAGPATLTRSGTSYPLSTGMYAAVPGSCRITGGSGIAITRHLHEGFFLLGGPVEEKGRLRYIDGCTDSLLIPPPRLGDPCLNLLHLPEHTRQTRHTHPSHRVGIIVSGSGHCRTPEESIPLDPGLVFVIPTGAPHSFHTTSEALRVIAYHPETDFGPTDECHPMVNKTIIAKP